MSRPRNGSIAWKHPGRYTRMYMAYTTNPHLPRVRRDAVNFVRAGHTTREAARHFGYTHSAIARWMKKAPPNSRRIFIPTRSSHPHHHPNELGRAIARRIFSSKGKRKLFCVALLSTSRAAGTTLLATGAAKFPPHLFSATLEQISGIRKIASAILREMISSHIGAGGRIRTSVARRALDLQSSAFDRSAPPAHITNCPLIS